MASLGKGRLPATSLGMRADPGYLLYARHITVQSLGEDIARNVGSSVQRQRFYSSF